MTKFYIKKYLLLFNFNDVACNVNL